MALATAIPSLTLAEAWLAPADVAIGLMATSNRMAERTRDAGEPEGRERVSLSGPDAFAQLDAFMLPGRK